MTALDGTLDVAKRIADVAVSKVREGQSKGVLYGMNLAKFPIIVTIDADLENNPELIPPLIQKLEDVDLAVASRTVVPRFSENLLPKLWAKKLAFQIFTPTLEPTKKKPSKA